MFTAGDSPGELGVRWRCISVGTPTPPFSVTDISSTCIRMYRKINKVGMAYAVKQWKETALL